MMKVLLATMKLVDHVSLLQTLQDIVPSTWRQQLFCVTTSQAFAEAVRITRFDLVVIDGESGWMNDPTMLQTIDRYRSQWHKFILLTNNGENSPVIKRLVPDAILLLPLRQTKQLSSVIADLLNQPLTKSADESLESLVESEERYRNLVELSPEIIVVYDKERVLYTNQAGAEFVGVATPDQVIGHSLFEWFHPSVQENLQSFIQIMFNDETVRQQIERTLVMADGRICHIEFTAAPITYKGQPAQQAIIRDITTRKQTEEALKQNLARQEALADISRTLAEISLDSPAVLDTVVQRVAEVIGDACVLSLFTDDSPEITPLTFYHPDAKARAIMGEVLTAATAWPKASPFSTQIFKTEQPLRIPELSPAQARQQLPAIYRPFIDQVGVHSLLIVPLRAESEMIGTLGVTRDTPGRSYTAEDQQILQQLADRAALCILNIRLFATERRRRRQMDALSTKLAEVEETERRELARELHDQIGQYLTALGINVNVIRTLLDNNASDEQIHDRLDDSEALIEQTLRRVRNIMAELRPAVLDDYGLAAALDWYGRQFEKRTGIVTRIEGQALSPRLPTTAETALFRIAQEALTNAARHAQANNVTLVLESTADIVRLTIGDDGVGFDRGAFLSFIERQHWGIFIMRERAQSLGGTLQIETASGEGTAVIVEVPR